MVWVLTNAAKMLIHVSLAPEGSCGVVRILDVEVEIRGNVSQEVCTFEYKTNRDERGLHLKKAI